MVGVLISIWSLVGGSWSVVCGLWSVAGRWSVAGDFVLRPFRECSSSSRMGLAKKQ